MAQPYVGEIKMFGGNFAPVGWAFCNGQALPISEYETLFNLIGTTYGGDGQETFQLPDLQSRIPLHTGNGFILAETGGVEQVTLTVTQLPAHTHPLLATTGGATQNTPAGTLLGATSGTQLYVDGVSPDNSLAANSMSIVGGNQPHDNRQPFLAVNFILSLFGIFPSQT